MAKPKKKSGKNHPRSDFMALDARKRLREQPRVKARQLAQARKGKNRSNLA